MSQRLVDVTNVKADSASGKITPEEESRAEKKARRAKVYDRGVIGDRLYVELPEGLYGEWVKNDVVEIHRKEGLGFKIDTEYAKRRALHDKGDGASYVGDVVFMVCSKEDKEIIDEIRRERYEATHNPKSGKQKEERDFLGTAPEGPAVGSKINKTGVKDITNALMAAANNNQ